MARLPEQRAAEAAEKPSASAQSAATGPASPRSARSALTVASVGTYSGPIGATIKPVMEGAKLWVAAVNHRGGVAGRLVNFRVYDDGADPARHRSQLQQAIEQDHVIAFLMNGEAGTGEGSVQYITEQRVPIIGVTGAEEWAFTSPMYFPQASTGNALWSAAIHGVGSQAASLGKTKLGTLVCVEAPICDYGERVFSAEAAGAGFGYVYRGRASMPSPTTPPNAGEP